MKMHRPGLVLLGLITFIGARAGAAGRRDVTFLSTSDCHYAAVKNEDRNTRDLDTVRAMNAVTDLSWPDSVGGGRVQTPRGVVVLGDLVDEGDTFADGVNHTQREWAGFTADFGLDGTDGVLRYPAFEGWGNHDGPPADKVKNGFSVQAQLKTRTAARRQKSLVANVSENGMHYSWDWDDIHFVQLNIYAADKQREGVRYSPDWHNPQGALSFLKDDLAKSVGTSGRPVVLMSHCGFDTDWWTKEDWADLYNAAKPYNVVLYLYGHSGTGVREWAPEGQSPRWLCINDGQTENGFFVVNIQGDRLRFGYRIKKWSEGKKVEGDTKPAKRTWNGEWLWKWTGSADLTRKGTAKANWE